MRDQQGTPKMMRMEGSQSEEHNVIFKLKQGQLEFSSFNPIRLVGALREMLGKILNARILADGKLLVFCKSAAHLAKAVALEAIGKR